MLFERRYMNADFEVRGGQDGTPVVVAGHGAVFNKRSQKLFEPRLGPFVEQVIPGAFAKTLREADVTALFNHDPNLILGRSSAGTLRVGEDNIGLAYDFDVPDTTYGRDLAVSMGRRDVTKSSFSFRVIGDQGETWSTTDDGFPLRSLNELGVQDVSPVTYPAYMDTDVGLRMALSGIAEKRGISASEAMMIAKSGQLGPLVLGRRVDRHLVERALTDPTYNDKQQQLSDAITKMMAAAGADTADCGCWVRDMTDDWCVYECYGVPAPGTFRVTYTIGADGVVALGDPEAVMPITTYEAIPAARSAADVASARLQLYRRRRAA